MKLVLVVEDEFGNAEVLQLLLEAHGYRVDIASNGLLALEHAQREAPAVIVSDFMMPIMNGAELGAAIRRDPNLASIPFVILSATSEATVRRSFSDYDAFVGKPFDLDSLLGLIDRLVASGRTSQPRSEDVNESMRHLLKGIKLPPGA